MSDAFVKSGSGGPGTPTHLAGPETHGHEVPFPCSPLPSASSFTMAQSSTHAPASWPPHNPTPAPRPPLKHSLYLNIRLRQESLLANCSSHDPVFFSHHHLLHQNLAAVRRCPPRTGLSFLSESPPFRKIISTPSPSVTSRGRRVLGQAKKPVKNPAKKTAPAMAAQPAEGCIAGALHQAHGLGPGSPVQPQAKMSTLRACLAAITRRLQRFLAPPEGIWRLIYILTRRNVLAGDEDQQVID
jgi:hypothetical protein